MPSNELGEVPSLDIRIGQHGEAGVGVPHQSHPGIDWQARLRSLAVESLSERVEAGGSAAGIDLQPVYIDVAVRRWQKLTGKAATLDGDGRSWAAIAKARNVRVG